MSFGTPTSLYEPTEDGSLVLNEYCGLGANEQSILFEFEFSGGKTEYLYFDRSEQVTYDIEFKAYRLNENEVDSQTGLISFDGEKEPLGQFNEDDYLGGGLDFDVESVVSNFYNELGLELNYTVAEIIFSTIDEIFEDEGW